MKTELQIFPGILLGGETGTNGWARWITGSEPGKSLNYALGVGGIAMLLYRDPSWDFRKFDFDRDVRLLDEKLGPVRNATDAMLKGFKARSGKLVLYHGWSDADVTPLSTTNYYDYVVTAMGQQNARELLRAYMVPGMQHCGEGPGATVLGSTPGTGADPQHGIQAGMQTRFVYVSVILIFAALILVSTRLAAAEASGLAGTWRGDSVCATQDSACHNERVVYYIKDVANSPNRVSIQADKIVEGKPITMGTGEWQYDRAISTLEWRMSKQVWLLKVTGSRMEGTLKLMDGTVLRNMSLKKDE